MLCGCAAHIEKSSVTKPLRHSDRDESSPNKTRPALRFQLKVSVPGDATYDPDDLPLRAAAPRPAHCVLTLRTRRCAVRVALATIRFWYPRVAIRHTRTNALGIRDAVSLKFRFAAPDPRCTAPRRFTLL